MDILLFLAPFLTELNATSQVAPSETREPARIKYAYNKGCLSWIKDVSLGRKYPVEVLHFMRYKQTCYAMVERQTRSHTKYSYT